MRIAWTRSLWPDSASSELTPRSVDSATPFNSRSEEHTSELQSLMRISYAVFCLKKKKKHITIIIKYLSTKYTDRNYQRCKMLQYDMVATIQPKRYDNEDIKDQYHR